jgi:hypothetical protein
MKNNNYVTLMGWMFNDLNLKGNEVLIYGLIYGFAQDGKSEFEGSLGYIEDTLNLSRNTVISTLKKLIKNKHIVKRQKSVNKVIYNTYVLGSSVSALGSAETNKKVVQKLTKGSAISAPNNTINNTNKESDSALSFLKENSPQRYEVFEMQYKSKIENWIKFIKDFNNKVIIEGLEFDINKLFARLETYAGNWILNNQKNKGSEVVKSAQLIKWSK